MAILFSTLRVVLAVLTFFSRRRVVRLERKRWAALAMSKDLHSSMLEQMQSEDLEIRTLRKIPKAQARLDRLLGFRDRLTSATGRKIPYLIGTVDASLVWI